ncbi:hypothetical protein AAZX31_09G095100 [Glycine max]
MLLTTKKMRMKPHLRHKIQSQNEEAKTETHFRCRSSKEIKNYENYGSPPQLHKVKTQAKEERNDKTKNETETYIHKETRFRCRSLEEIKNYKKYGSHPRRHKVKTQDKEESNDKTKNEIDEMIDAEEKNKEAKIEFVPKRC